MEDFTQRFSIAANKVGFFIVILIALNVANLNATPNEIVDGNIKLSPLITDLPSSWALEVSPDNFLYVSHRHGKLAKYSLSGKKVANYDLSLSDLYHKGQGGLSAIAFHPNFDQVPWIYLSYSYGSDKANGLKVIRVLLQNSGPQSATVLQKETIYEQSDLRDTAVHYGARLAFMADNSLLIATGDGFDYRETAQKFSSDMGKILRVTDTGQVPDNNPFANAQSTVQRYVYSRGHRNPQALIVLSNNQVIAHEHGPAGGDEINIIKPGNNYGWPVITQGKDYIGSLITPFTEYAGMEQPGYDWTPSIAPSGMVYYQHERIKPFANRLLVSSLKFQQLHTLTINKQQIENEVVHFAKSGYRMKDLAISNEGRVFILSDGNSASIFEVLINM